MEVVSVVLVFFMVFLALRGQSFMAIGLLGRKKTPPG
jgi:hypothetical protein